MASYSAVSDILLGNAFRYVARYPIGRRAEQHIREAWMGVRGDFSVEIDNGQVASVRCGVLEEYCSRPDTCPFGPRAHGEIAPGFDLADELAASLTACDR